MPVNPIGLEPETLETLSGPHTDAQTPDGVGETFLDDHGAIASGAAGTDQPGSGGFAKLLVEAVGRVNQMQAEADHQADLVATGAAENAHRAVIAIEKANLALELTVKVTEKALGAYKQISQMQL